jgi:hypothetical protein
MNLATPKAGAKLELFVQLTGLAYLQLCDFSLNKS